MKSRDYTFLRKKRGTHEWLIEKWTRKLWKAYPVYATKGACELPSFLRKEFFRDIELIVEHRIKEIFPERSVANILERDDSKR